MRNLCIAAALVICLLFSYISFAGLGETIFNFEGIETGSLPSGWKAAATNQERAILPWGVINDSENKVLGIADGGEIAVKLKKFFLTMHDIFNICWTDTVRFKDGEIELSFKAVSGRIDRGGGPIWRVLDANNYYIARANPLEKNFRIYYVKNGFREMLASADVKAPSGVWDKIRIVHRGNKIEGYLNGIKYIEVMDATLPEQGGIGVWTKADALTYFDDIKVSLSIGE